jgi:cellobiose-specific phosphotransferase system component IIB
MDIKTENIKKEEIPEEKKKKNREEFIASLARQEEEIIRENDDLEMIQGEKAPWKKMVFAVAMIIAVGGAVGSGYVFWFKEKGQSPADNTKNESTLLGQTENSAETNNLPNSQAETENAPTPVQEILPAEINIKVLNSGALAGSAGKVSSLLVSKGYKKAQAGNGESENVSGSFVYFSGEEFKKQAEAVNEILIAGKIKSEMKEAATAEQKSADVVVILGK